MRRVHGLAAGLMVLSSLTTGGLAPVALAAEPEPQLTATLDGKPIPVEDVGKYFCDDFSYPEITCSSSRPLALGRATLVGLLSGVEYVTIYDLPTFAGSFMNVSEDYPALSFIGWNDRISSYKARNSESGAFWTDWFYGGTRWTFCCNQQVSNLGGYSNAFSSIQRT